MSDTYLPEDQEAAASEPQGLTLSEALDALKSRMLLLSLGPLLCAALALGVTFLIAPTFTASTLILPPQQGQTGAASALASLGSLAGLAGAGTVSSPGERYVAMLQSATVSDRIVEQFKLMQVYDVQLKVDARRKLATYVRIGLGRKDGLINIEVDDEDPRRAAELANGYVEELRRLTATLAVTEAQQRRLFFERQLQASRDRLAQAQSDLQASGFDTGALKAEPKAAADAYARLKAEATSAATRLQIMRGTLADETPEVRQQQALLSALREQLSRAEQASDQTGGTNYIGKYREFKYQETLFELYARQFELARVDESREGALIQVIDVATPPERKSKPRRGAITALTLIISAAVLLGWVITRRALQPAQPR